MNPIFVSIRVSHRFFGNTAIQWKLAGAAPGGAAAVFTIEWARTGAGPWHKCDGAVVYSAGYAIDPRQRIYGSEIDIFYRVKLVADGQVYYSRASQAGAFLPDAGWAAAEETLRLLQMNYNVENNFDVSPGCLYKRRIWGPKCDYCASPETAEIIKTDCPHCFGTGILRGYYDPVSAPLLVDPRVIRHSRIASEAGPTFSAGRTAKGIAFPVPFNDRDLWFNSQTGELYQIALEDQIKATTQIGNLVLEQQFPFELVAADDVSYHLDFDKCQSLSFEPAGTMCEPWIEPEPDCRNGLVADSEEDVLDEVPERVIETPPPAEESGEQMNWEA